MGYAMQPTADAEGCAATAGDINNVAAIAPGFSKMD